jgi:hypothetical protein
LWGPRITKAFEDMGVLGFDDTDLDSEMAGDEAAAEEIDAKRQSHINAVGGA